MSSGFITEGEIEERKRVRQAEWDKVRKPEDPLDAPEEAAPDNRSLYDRLQEQKMRKQEEFEEAHKLKNLVKGLDDDEADFLEFVDKTKMDLERQKREEEMKELNEFRSKMAQLREEELTKHIKQELGLVKNEKIKSKSYDDELPSIGTRKTTQSKLLAGIVKRKAPPNICSPLVNDPEGVAPKRPRTAEDNVTEEPPKVILSASTSSTAKVIATTSETETDYLVHSVPYKGSLVCIGVLPGLASYSDSSNSDDNSSDSESGDSVARDICGRQILPTSASEEDHEGKKKK